MKKLLTLAAAAALAAAGCQESGPRTTTAATTSARASGTATGEDVRREAGEAADAAGRYAGQKAEEYRKDLKAKLADLDRKLADWQVRMDKATEQARKDMKPHYEAAKVKRDELARKLDEAGKDSGKAWDDLKVGLDRAWGDLKDSFDKAEKHFRD